MTLIYKQIIKPGIQTRLKITFGIAEILQFNISF